LTHTKSVVKTKSVLEDALQRSLRQHFRRVTVGGSEARADVLVEVNILGWELRPARPKVMLELDVTVGKGMGRAVLKRRIEGCGEWMGGFCDQQDEWNKLYGYAITDCVNKINELIAQNRSHLLSR
jgi:hypothetical protein